MTTTFKFKWAYMTASDTTMQYTSSVNIPIWNYTKLKKITVYGVFLNNTIVLFDKTRSTNPAISSDTPSFNLHNELVEYEKIRFILDGKRYGDPYTMLFYVEVNKINDKFVTTLREGDKIVKEYYVEYTYDVLGYDNSLYKKNNVPLQFIFKEYIFSPTDIQQYKSMGYTANEMKAAGIKFSVLLGGGYNMDELFSALWSFHTNNPNDFIDNPNDFIDYFNSLKNGNPAITAENASMKNANLVLNNENASLKNAAIMLNNKNASLENTNLVLNNENASLKNANLVLNNENVSLKNANLVLNNDNVSLQTANMVLGNENVSLQTANMVLNNENVSLKNANTSPTINNSCSIQICKWSSI